MEAASPSHGGVSGGGNCGGTASAGDGERAVFDDGLDELWPSRPSAAAQMLAEVWVENPETSARWTSGLGGVDLDPEVWDVRIHFDGMDNLEWSIGCDDITYMNIIAMIETRGYRFGDSVYCRMGGEMHLVENNVKIYELLMHFDSTKVLDLTVKRGRDVVSKQTKSAEQDSIAGDNASCLINYSAPIVYDFSPPPVYAVDDDGQVFTSQVASNNPVACSQPSQNLQKGIALSESDDDAEMGSYDGEYDYDMGDFANSAEIRREEQAEVDEIVEAMRKQREDPLTHCEGDTYIEDLFVEEDEPVVEEEAEPVHVPEKKSKLPVKRKGPTDRSHSVTYILFNLLCVQQPNRGEDAPTSSSTAPSAPTPTSATAPSAPSAPPRAPTAPSAPPSAASQTSYAPPRTAAAPGRRPATESEYEAGYPAYKKTRTWSYLNCGYSAEQDEQEGGPSN
ncbi:hypothetical protein ACQ4PT_050805 [Festuca glaucescens]